MASTDSERGGVKTRICMISDTHNYAPLPKTMDTPYRWPLPRADVLLHAGDLTMVGKLEEHQIMIDMLKRADAELKIVIAGNHDITLDEKYYNAGGHLRHRRTGREDLAQIRELYCGEEAKSHGIVYLEEGLNAFTLKNGARFTIYTSPYQPEFCRWAFAYERDEDRFNPSSEGADTQPENPVPDFPNVDIMLTHGPPHGIGDLAQFAQNVGCVNLRRAVDRARPRIHCFGHIHEGYGAYRMDWQKREIDKIRQDRDAELRNHSARMDLTRDSEKPLRLGEETLFVNASVVTIEYEPSNAPWLVDIDLPRAPEPSNL